MKTQKTYSVQEAKVKIEHYCAYQERCHKEVVDKLKSMKMIPIAIDNIMYHLIKENFLNETRFAKSFARGKFNIKHWGRIRITNELKFRQISNYNIKLALQEISDEEYTNKLYAISLRKNELLNEPNIYKRKKKLNNYLIYRGWEPYLVYEVTRELIT